MQEIKLTMEIPTAHLKDYWSMTDLDFCLAHLVHEDSTYREFYHERVARGRTVILDNGVFELGNPLSVSQIIEAADMLCFEHLKPIVIAPDHPCNMNKTVDCSFDMLRQAGGRGYRVGACCQGSDVDEIVECYRKLLMAPFEPVCLTFMSPMYHVLMATPLYFNRWHHLFGMYDLEYIRWLRTFIPFPNTLSMDTSKPIKAGIEMRRLREYERGRGKWNPNTKMTSKQMSTAYANVRELQMFCKGFIEPYHQLYRIPSLESEYWKGSFHVLEKREIGDQKKTGAAV